MSEKKYVHSGAFMLCNKCVAPVPIPLTVTAQVTVSIPGGLMATDLDKYPVANVPPFGVCALTHVPCTYAPAPLAWSGVQEDVLVGPWSGHALLEDSKLHCVVGGQISLFLTRATAMATLPDVVSRGFDSAYAYLEGVGPPFGGELRDELGKAKGLWQGLRDMGTGLWELAKLKAKFDQKVDDALLFAVAHPVEAAHAVGAAAQTGWQAATDKDNWLAAGKLAVDTNPGVLAVRGGIWLSDAQNRAKVGVAFERVKAWEAGLTDYERSTLKGRVVFEVAALLVPETKIAEVAKVGELAKAGEAADGLRLLGEVKTGAKGVAEAEKAPGLLDEVRAAVEECFEVGHPVDVATGVLFTQATDFTLPGPVPLVWARTWFSCSTHQGVLGHGWHHAYDLGLTLTAEGGATLRRADDRRALFDPPAPGQRSFNRRHKLELALEPTGPQVWDTRQQLWYVFEPIGPDAHLSEQRLAAVENAHGARIQFAYTAAGHLTTLTDSAGRVLACETDAAGRLLAIQAPAPSPEAAPFALVRYTYDEAGDMRAATDALGHAARFTYEGHLLTRETFRSGLNFYFTYDGTGPAARCMHTWGDGGIFDTKLRYDGPGHTTAWNSYGYETSYFHRRGLVTRSQDARGVEHRWDYNLYAELERAVDPLGQVTSYTYDARGNQTRITYPDGIELSTQYNNQQLPAQGTDANGNAWQWEYDAQGQLTQATDPGGATTRYTYDAQGRTASMSNALGYTTRLRYDAHGNLAHAVAPDDTIRSRGYDALGRLVTLTDALGHVERRHYDRRGQLVGVQPPEGPTQQYAYDAAGNVVRADEDGQQPVELAYTPMGQLAERRQAGQAVAFRYDLEGNLTGLTNEHGEQYRFELDTAGQVVAETGFDGLTRRYVRDAAGRVTHIERPAGRTTAYTYDAAGRIAEVVHNQTEYTRYGYRADGALLEATTATATVQFECDALGRVLREIQNGQQVRTTYDAAGQRQGLTSSLGADIRFTRDAVGQVRQTTAGAWQSVVARDAEGLELHRQLSGSLRTGWQRDALGRPISQRLTAGGGTQHQRRYQWQGTDQLTELVDSTHGTTHFTHDERGYLTAATYADGTQELRQPDAVGNLFRTAERTDRRYGPGGQLRLAQGTRYHYDEEGNLIRKTDPDGKSWHYAWDGAGQLVRVTRPDSYAVTFTYDALGRRVSKRFRGQVTRWLWDGDTPLHEWQQVEVGAGASTVNDLITWLFEDDSFTLAAKLTASGIYSVVGDHLGTPLSLYDEQGKPTWEMSLDSYGGVRQGRGRPQDCPFRYQGQYEDVETGLYYNRFRYYDPQAGSYISQDPIGLEGGIAFYAYCENPLVTIDPFGLTPTPPQLPAKVIYNQDGVRVWHNYGNMEAGTGTPIEHAPIHYHAKYQGKEYRAFPSGKSLKDSAPLPTKVSEVFRDNRSRFQRIEKRIGKWFKEVIERKNNVCP